MLKTLIT